MNTENYHFMKKETYAGKNFDQRSKKVMIYYIFFTFWG